LGVDLINCDAESDEGSQTGKGRAKKPFDKE